MKPGQDIQPDRVFYFNPGIITQCLIKALSGDIAKKENGVARYKKYSSSSKAVRAYDNINKELPLAGRRYKPVTANEGRSFCKAPQCSGSNQLYAVAAIALISHNLWVEGSSPS